MRQRYTELISALCLGLLTITATATAASVDAPRLRMKIHAVDSGTFHLVASPFGNPMPPASPFVVKTADWAGATVHKKANTSSVRTSQGTFDLDFSGRWQLKGQSNHKLLLKGTVISADGKTVFSLKHPIGERFYGAGNQGLDTSGDLTHPSGSQLTLNGATRVPFLWSTGGYSIFIANNQSGVTWDDHDGTLTWTVPSPYADVYLSVAPDGYGLLDAFSRLTGRAPIPPRWTFGFMMSRWGYADNADVHAKWQGFRNRQIPVDAFIYDYDWFTNDWEFNSKVFPASNLAEMHRLGLRFVGIRKPRLTGANLEFGRKQGWMLNGPYGEDLRFDLPEASYWWWNHQVPLVQAGVDGWWNDEAEQTMDEFFQMSRVQWEGWRQLSPRRAWIINRAFAPGIQRFGAATWTGDTNSNWNTLSNQPGIMLNWSLAGMPYSSQDIGGFHGTPSPELYARWMESGVFIPIMRVHGLINTLRLPWEFGDDVLAASKKAIELRYRLIPYIYTFAEQTTRTGAPLMRPLILEFPKDPNTFNLRDEWLVGNRLLAAPVLTEGGRRDVYLPTGGWYDFNTGAFLKGAQTLHLTVPIDTIPSYVRAGTILPLGPVLQSTSRGAVDPLEVRIYPGANAAFSLYEDDGESYAYQRGAASRIPMKWNDKTKTFFIGVRSGTFPGMLRTRRINVVLPNKQQKTMTYKGQPTQISF